MSRRSYPLKLPWRLFLLGGGLAFLIVPVILALQWRAHDWGVIGAISGVVLLLVSVYAIGEAIVARRATGPDGLEQLEFLYRATVPWDAIDRVEVNPYGFVNLVLRQDAGSGCLPLVWYSRLFGYTRLIGLAGFVTDWRTSQLMADIDLYAPHLHIREPQPGPL